MSSAKWYAGGLRFECSQCGNCCSGPPGHVWVSKREIAKIAASIGREDKWLSKEHLRRVGFKYSLTEKPGGDCIFLKRDGSKTFCGIYKARPLQCRTWPFWSSNLGTEKSWDAAADTCPGINRGRRRDFVAVEELRLKKYG